MNENEDTVIVSAQEAENGEKETAEAEFIETTASETDGMNAATDNTDALSHPMFARFAKGKCGNIEDICRDFREMLAEMPQETFSDISAKMTPSVSANAAPDIALTERQRMIARAAGMSFREYYALVSDIPTKRNK